MAKHATAEWIVLNKFDDDLRRCTERLRDWALRWHWDAWADRVEAEMRGHN